MTEADLKDDLMDLKRDIMAPTKRTKVNELLLKLERLNPTQSPAESMMLNGVYEILYTGGLSPGMLAIQIVSRLAKQFGRFIDLKAVKLSIKRDQPRVEASLSLEIFGSDQTLRVFTRLEAESDVRLRETYVSVEIAGRTLQLPTFLQRSRTHFLTYLDEDVLVSRDDAGAPDLLVRKEKEDFRSHDGVPSADDAVDVAPGSG